MSNIYTTAYVIMMVCQTICAVYSVRKLIMTFRSDLNTSSRWTAAFAVLFFVSIMCALLYGVAGAKGALALVIAFNFVLIVTQIRLFHSEDVSAQSLWLMVFYIAGLFYITILARIGAEPLITEVYTTPQMTPLAILTIPELMDHNIQNVIMLVPMGFMLAYMFPRLYSGPSDFIISGLLVSSTLESFQLMLQVGQCDIDDIIMNTAGAMIGLAVYNYYVRIKKAKKNQKVKIKIRKKKKKKMKIKKALLKMLYLKKKLL